MVKVKDFWNYFCNDLEYRFFSGVPHTVFKNLYKKMNTSFLHYIPAVNANAAIGMVNGISLTGMNGAAIISMYDLETCLTNIKRFNFKYKIPLVLLINKEKESTKEVDEFIIRYNVNIVNLSNNFKMNLDAVTNISDGEVSLLLVEEGVFI